MKLRSLISGGIASAFLFANAFAGPTPPPGVTQNGAVTAAHCAQWVGPNSIQDSGGGCGGAVVAPLQLGSGSVSTPSYSFSAQPTSGYYYNATAGDTMFAVSGNDRLRLNGSGPTTGSVSGWCWTSSSLSTTGLDTCFWRIGAAEASLGGATPGTHTGILDLAGVKLFGSTSGSTTISAPATGGVNLALPALSIAGNLIGTTVTPTAGNCVEWSSAVAIGDTGSPCGTGLGNVNTTGTPAANQLTKFSGAATITNGDLSGDVTTSGGLGTTIAANAVTFAKFNQVAANTVDGNPTAALANVQAMAMPSCSAAGSALKWTTSAGFGCQAVVPSIGADHVMVATGSAGALNDSNLAVTQVGADSHIGVEANGVSAPVLSACGTTPVLGTNSNDASGTITTGTGTPTSCTLTFHTAYAGHAPACIAQDHTTQANLTLVAPSTTAIVFTTAAASSQVIDYICVYAGSV